MVDGSFTCRVSILSYFFLEQTQLGWLAADIILPE